ncbi:uncharacterized protein F4817DRAFT_324412 [Daldinia loculata]|uniref:uncharacterized protein n=1 Tax=Daldinia loculata TaxID=103429 RepID=UPI0020C4B979|nr:uncharacterized protein F4817DRAFT_324412 [Daldinia loculata]KAI1651395.1 hypothetical protein F4817DRAFT_324412 [Daldinia loculata]
MLFYAKLRCALCSVLLALCSLLLYTLNDHFDDQSMVVPRLPIHIRSCNSINARSLSVPSFHVTMRRRAPLFLTSFFFSSLSFPFRSAEPSGDGKYERNLLL